MIEIENKEIRSFLFCVLKERALDKTAGTNESPNIFILPSIDTAQITVCQIFPLVHDKYSSQLNIGVKK